MIDLSGVNEVALAAEFAARVHARQRDKIGNAYIEHPRRVFQNLLAHPGLFTLLDPDEIVAALAGAWLHDVVEDSAKHFEHQVTFDVLRSLGFSDATIEVVRLLTRNLDRAGDAYYDAIASHRAARLVKLADIIDNLQPRRVAELPFEKKEQLSRKYSAALERLDLLDVDRLWLEARHQES